MSRLLRGAVAVVRSLISSDESDLVYQLRRELHAANVKLEASRVLDAARTREMEQLKAATRRSWS